MTAEKTVKIATALSEIGYDLIDLKDNFSKYNEKKGVIEISIIPTGTTEIPMP